MFAFELGGRRGVVVEGWEEGRGACCSFGILCFFKVFSFISNTCPLVVCHCQQAIPQKNTALQMS